MNVPFKTIYAVMENITLHRITGDKNYHNIDAATIMRAKRSTKHFLLLAESEAHLTNDPERTANRYGYRDFEIYEIERL